MRFVLAAGLAAALCGCAQVSQLTVADTAKAVAVAQAVGDAPAVACFTGFNQLANAVGGPVVLAKAGMGNGEGGPTAAAALATKIEVVRGVRQVLRDDCGSLSADFLANVAHGLAGPFAGLVP